MFLGSNMHVMMQAPEEGNGSDLPHRLSIMNIYTKMATGSKQVAVMGKNLTAALISITKGAKITQVIAANAIPQVGVAPGTLGKLNEMQGIQRAKMSVEHRKKHSSNSRTCWAWGVVYQEWSYHMHSTS